MTKILTRNFFFRITALLAGIFLLVIPLSKVRAAACVASVGGAWESTGTWTGCGVTGIPTSADTVDIVNGKPVNINSAAVCSSLTFGTGNNTTALTINLSNSLTVGGNITVNGRTGSGNHTIAVGAGTLTATGSLSLIGGGGTGRAAQITISTGTVNISGDITGSSLDANIIFSGAGTLNVGGSMTGLTTFTASTGTVNFNGSTASVAGNYTYNVLKSNNTAGVTLGGASTITTLTIGDVTSNSVFSNGGFVITPGASSVLNLISGTDKLGSATVGTPMAAWGTMNISAGTTVEYASGVAQVVSTTPSYKNLTFSGAGAKTTAAGTLTVGGNWSVTGGTATLNTNNSAVTVTGNITGTGAITSGSGTISLTGDWTNSGTFTKGTGTVTYNGGSTQTVGALTYNNLTINKAGGSASLGGSGTRVDGVLTLTSGNITTSSNNIYISSTGSVSRTSGHIVGNLKKNIATGATSKTFEIGDSSNYTPVSITFGNVTVAGDLTAKTTAGDHPQISSSTIDSSKSINRYWTLTNSGITFNNYSAVLNFINPGDVDSGANTANFIVGLYNAGWTYPTVGTKNSTNTQATGVTGFGDFQLGELFVDSTAPAAVSNLATSGPTNNSINLSWTAPGDDSNTGTATTYDMRYSTAPITSGNFSSATQATGEPSPSIAGSAESMTISGLSASTLYYFALKTSDEVPNTSAISNLPTGTTTATPDTTAPAAISDLATINPTSNSIDLTWTAPGDDSNTGTATTYDMRYSTSPITSVNFSSATQATGEPSPSIAGSSESMTISGLSASTLYYFALKTSDEVPNTSAISNLPTGTTTATPDTTAPAAVSNLATTNPTNNSIDLTWTAPGDDNNTGTATIYDVRYSTSPITSGNFSSATAATGEPSPSIAGTSESMTISGLSATTLYYFAIKTSDEVPNTSAISNLPTGTTTATPDTTAPAAISDLSTTNATNNSIDLLWTAPGDDSNTGTATVYDVRYSTSVITSGNFASASQATGEPSPSIAGSSESMTISGLSASTLYYFAIKTSDEVPNTSAISNVANRSTTATPDTTAPAAVSDLATTNPTNNSIDLTWVAPGDDSNTGTATVYDVRYSTSVITSVNFSSATQATGEPTPAIAGTSESMTISGLSASTLYYFALKTSDEVPNTSAISNVVNRSTTATPDTTAPAAVSDLATTNPTNNSIDITWVAPGDDSNTGTATTYDVRYSTSPITSGNFASASQATGEPSPSIAGSSESMTISGLSASTLYYFALKTSDEVPNTSAISNVPTGTTTAIPDTTAPAAVSDLSTANATTNSIDLLWTAPGDDSNTGTATTYDVRYSTSPITSGNFASATQATGEPTPAIAGTSESMTISGLSASTLYYFALKTSDEVPNTSAISNVANRSTITGADTTAPTVTAFSIPTTSSSLTVTITTFTATDAVGVTRYLVNESASTPSVSDSNWVSSAPSSYIFSTEGSKTLYAWAKDAAGNISTSLSDTVTITLPVTATINPSQIQSTISGGTIVPNNVLTSSSQITFTQQVQINFTTGSVITVPTNTVMSAGSNVDFSQLSAASTVSACTLPENYSSIGAVNFGLPSSNLTATQAVTVSIFVGSTYNTQTFYVYKRSPSESSCSQLTTCVISGSLCEFTTTGFSDFFAANFVSPATTSGGTSGGVSPTIVSFSGRAYPDSKVRVYRRSTIESSFKNDYLPNFDIDTNSKGDFNKAFTGLLQSNYLFALEGIDKTGLSGGIISFTGDLIGGNNVLVGEIFLPPTISIQDKFITKGNEIKVTGYAYPNSNIELKIDNVLRLNAKANDFGYYEAIINTSRFSPKTHFIASKQTDRFGRSSEFSTSKNFIVSALSNPRADFNADNIIDIKDWSIFLFRWKANPTLRAFNDLNLDGKVDVSDLSIFLKAMRGL